MSDTNQSIELEQNAAPEEGVQNAGAPGEIGSYVADKIKVLEGL